MSWKTEHRIVSRGRLMAAFLGTVVFCVAFAAGRQSLQQTTTAKREGYTDTPFLPGGQWRVHDAARPYPRVITAGTESSAAAPGSAPSDATVLFNGKDLSGWLSDDRGRQVEPRWKVENGWMEIVPRSGSLVTKGSFGDCQLHIEWATPATVKGNSQSRGNSGVLLMGRYEVQVLDSSDNLTYADGQAAAMYGQYPPLVNASRGPGEWQTYDLVFEAPRFEGEKLARPAYLTLFHNGVLMHNHQAYLGQTAHKTLARYVPHPAAAPLVLQDHGTPVRYRNIWIRRLGNYDEQ
jgi:hypothetical protein